MSFVTAYYCTSAGTESSRNSRLFRRPLHWPAAMPCGVWVLQCCRQKVYRGLHRLAEPLDPNINDFPSPSSIWTLHLLSHCFPFLPRIGGCALFGLLLFVPAGRLCCGQPGGAVQVMTMRLTDAYILRRLCFARAWKGKVENLGEAAAGSPYWTPSTS